MESVIKVTTGVEMTMMLPDISRRERETEGAATTRDVWKLVLVHTVTWLIELVTS